MMKIRNTALALFALLIFCNSCAPKIRNIYYYIPYGYVGYIAIVLDQKTKNNPVEFNDEFHYFIRNKPCYYPIKKEKRETGYFHEYFYYCNEKDTLLLKSSGNLAQVSPTSFRSITDEKGSFNYISFYISDTIKEINEIYHEMERKESICR